VSQIFHVVDFETTDVDKARLAGKPAEVCEAGLTIVHDGEVSRPTSWFVNPGHPIPPQARAVHHISDADVAGAVSPVESARTIVEKSRALGSMLVAHNAKFEMAFLDAPGRKWICTMVCAKHLWPDAPGYSNQCLRYWLDLDALGLVDAELAMPVHRAGPDTHVTAGILLRLLRERSAEELHRLTFEPVLQKRVMFGGEHHGRLWSELDTGLLEWVLKKDFDDETKATARHWLAYHRSKTTVF
jgi:exodeoxyribonuclease X